MRHLRFVLIALVALFLDGVCQSHNASAALNRSQSGQQVVIYSGPGYTGRSQVLNDSWSGGGYFDRRVRSIRVPPGTRVWLFTEPNYGGTQTLRKSRPR